MQALSSLQLLLLVVYTVILILTSKLSVESTTMRRFNWQIVYTNVTRLCHTKSIISVNGQFPGPIIYVREDDTLEINITNLVLHNITIHWHGVHQLLSAWSDGTAYITQCPIQTGQSYSYRFQIKEQRGTLLWHAHSSWLRATVYGSFIILPSTDIPVPFSTTAFEEMNILLGEWWNSDVEDVIAEALATGGGYKVSDAITINGQPGSLYNCSKEGTVIYNVVQGETYLLRIANAALNFQMFFSVANHSLTIVEADAEYTEPYTTDVLLLAPGQTTNALLTTTQSIGQYLIAASIFSPPSKSEIPFPQIPATAILHYQGSTSDLHTQPTLTLPTFPAFNDNSFATNFTRRLRIHSASLSHPGKSVPLQVDEHLFFTVGYSLQPCQTDQHCRGPSGESLAASINNISFQPPTVSLLQAYYGHVNEGVYESDFPDMPLLQYNYTGVDPKNKNSMKATKVKVLNFNTTIQIIFQDTATILKESHPVHIHGHNFHVVGAGDGNYDPIYDPKAFNLKNPPYRNTISVPAGGWVAIRFRAQNPGVWYIHCHLEIHNSWGMSMALIVKDGLGLHQKLPPPPNDLPPC